MKIIFDVMKNKVSYAFLILQKMIRLMFWCVRFVYQFVSYSECHSRDEK